MLERKILRVSKDNNKIVYFKTSSETFILFAASLLWPMIDSYYVAVLFMLSLLKTKGIE
jgi:hypothetical protein